MQNNQICKYLYYVQSGSLRVYGIDDHALENNVYFAIDDWWVVDLRSFVEETPARFNIQALTDCRLLSVHKSKFDYLLEQIPVLEKWFRILLQNALISSENRINNKIALTAELRYLEFLKKYPNLELQIAQKHIASYLGITAEHLSKIKSKRIRSKP
ncbi:MAG: Crp/Fnr family transcriptional regulator [Bacteroidia bacterium]|nr:Crp/Fnr family transcriptional regulator [Bacteroidia bacterium]